MPWLAVAQFPDVNGQAADTVENSFAFNASTSNDAVGAVLDFYENATAQIHPVGFYLGDTVSRVIGQAKVLVYDLTGHLSGDPHGSPVQVDAFATGAPPGHAGTDLPRQCALTLAYQGAGISGVLEHGPEVSRPTDEEGQDEGAPATRLVKTRPKASHRGRIRIGPLNAQAIGPDGNIATNCLNDMKVALHRLLTGTGVGIAANPGWSVWSRTLGELDLVIGGWVDQELGVVRRRKNKAAIHDPWV